MTAAASVGRRDHQPQTRVRPTPLTARRGGDSRRRKAQHRRYRNCRPPRSGTFRPHGKRHPGGARRRGGGFGRGGRPQRRRARGRGPAAEDPGPGRPGLDPPDKAAGTAPTCTRNQSAGSYWGHQVTLVAGEYPGCLPVERSAPQPGRAPDGRPRVGVPARRSWAVMRGLGRDADVVFEVINGITFLTPAVAAQAAGGAGQPPAPRALYLGEFGSPPGPAAVRRPGAAAAAAALPPGAVPHHLRLGARRAGRVDGIPAANITIAYCGVGPGRLRPGRASARAAPALRRAPEGLQAHRGAVRRARPSCPRRTLDIAGHGDHGETLDDEIARRGLGERVRVHGYVDEQTKADLYARPGCT